MKKTCLLSLLLLTFFSLSAQTPCVANMAGIYPCNDYALMSHMDLNTFSTTSANDSWGWTDSTTGKEYAIMGIRNGTVFVDITDPLNLIYLGTLPTATGNSSWRDIKVYQNHAFIVSEASNHGMQVFDLTKLRSVTNPPETFASDAHYTGFGRAHNIVINEDTGYAYAVGVRNYNANGYNYAGGAHFINIQNPTSPTPLGGYAGSGYTHDAQVVIYNGPDTEHVGKEIYIGSNEDRVVIVDVSTKTNPVLLGTVFYSGVVYTHQGWLTEDHKHFILGDEVDEINNGHNTRSYIFDFSDLDNPTHTSTYESNNTSTDHNGYILGDTFYLASYKAGLRVLDISNINAPNEIGYFDTYTANDNAGTSGAWNVYPYFASGNIVISDISGGLFVVRKSNTLGVNELEQPNSFSLSPNPTTTNPIIKANQTKNIKQVAVYNILGQQVFFKDNINFKEFVIPTQNLAKGMYLVKINTSITKKLILK
ncbi:MAG: choice-of-anchor B family protein [Oceanihabitans sp.]